MAYRSIQKSSTPELVMREILASIESGQLKPGDKLPTERELSKMFGAEHGFRFVNGVLDKVAAELRDA